MWEEPDVEEAIAEYPRAVEDALLDVKRESGLPLVDAATLRASAAAAEVPFEGFLVDWLKRKSILESFVRALTARGVPIDLEPLQIEDSNVDPDALARFAGAAKGFRCRIRKGADIVGSGVLVGPNTVLTAWHVVAAAAPGELQDPATDIQVVLSDNKAIPARPPPAWQSMCGDREFEQRFPASDQEVLDRHDVALLRLERPASALLGAARLPEVPAAYKPSASVLLVHYPEGKDQGLGIGTVAKIRRLSARWSHNVATREGSSGGACFDASLSLLGIHQGKDPQGRGRLVPASCFYDHLREVVANDQTPDRMWSLDGTAQGELVIGRQAFFEAFAAARRYPRVRGIRIKRANAAGDLSGLPFSFRMLEQLVARRAELRLVRVSFEDLVEDVANAIARRASKAGIAVDPIEAEPGVAEGQSAPEAVGADRGRRVAALIDARAAGLELEAWMFIDHPAIAFGDAQRSALEGFIDAALRLDHIRLVIAGFEAVALPGQDFYGVPDPLEEGGRGFINEILSGFQAGDVKLFLNDAAKAAGQAPSDPYLDDLVAGALAGLENVNGIYEPWIAREVGERLRPHIAEWF